MSGKELPRFCRDCGVVFEGSGSRCHMCSAGVSRIKAKQRRERRGPTPNSARLSRRIRKLRDEDPNAVTECPMCRRFVSLWDVEVDHRVPLADGGTDHPHNVWAICVNCHRTKTADEDQARQGYTRR